MLTIIDYNTGNLSSIKNMLKHLGIESQITNDKKQIENADKLILPGVGHFDYGMQQLRKLDLIPLLNKKVLENKTPILGLCLGVQLFTQSSNEGKEKGLGWINGATIFFDKSRLSATQKIPNMGWQNVSNYNQSKLFENMHEEPRFYFAHSYHLKLEDKKDHLVSTNYGYDFEAGVEHENIIGVQFHPEKSHKYGMKLLENFVKNY